MCRQRLGVGLMLLGVLLLSNPRPVGATAYTFVSFNYPSYEDLVGYGTTVSGLNDAGVIVGYSTAVAKTSDGLFTISANGFLLTGTTFTSRGVFNKGINDAGTIVGYFTNTRGVHGYVRTEAAFVPFDVPGSLSTTAAGINDAGTIVGTFRDARGVHGYVRTEAAFVPFDVPGSLSTTAAGINDAGTIVGTFQDAGGMWHGYVWSGETVVPLDVPGSIATSAVGINNLGTIVGTFQDAGGTQHGYVWSGETVVPLDVPGGVLTSATGINDAGTVVGTFQAGKAHGFLATPVAIPEPATWLLVWTGLGGLFGWRWWRSPGWAPGRKVFRWFCCTVAAEGISGMISPLRQSRTWRGRTPTTPTPRCRRSSLAGRNPLRATSG